MNKTRELLRLKFAAELSNRQIAQSCDMARSTVADCLRQTHKAGDKLFVDYAEQTVAVIDRHRGQARHAQIFVATLGASNYSYAEATWSQGIEDWVTAHIRAFEFLQGCPALLVPDKLKSVLTMPHRYDPDVKRSYLEMARLEAACQRALHVGTTRYRGLESIVKNGLDQQPLPQPSAASRAPQHGNVRGAGDYH